eukprot:5386456-Pyramimonas_sp.AAC.1
MPFRRSCESGAPMNTFIRYLHNCERPPGRRSTSDCRRAQMVNQQYSLDNASFGKSFNVQYIACVRLKLAVLSWFPGVTSSEYSTRCNLSRDKSSVLLSRSLNSADALQATSKNPSGCWM